MTKRYDINLVLTISDGSGMPVSLSVKGKTMATIQNLVRAAMSDFEKVEPITNKAHKAIKVNPPIVPQPTEEDVNGI